MKLQMSARKSLLGDHAPPNNELQSSIQDRQYPQNQEAQNFNSKLLMKYQRLKDKSLVIEQESLPFYEQWLIDLDKKYSVIYPESKGLLAWNFFIVIAIFFNFFQIPMALFLTASVYESETNTSIGLAINILFLIGFYIDMFLIGFNIAFYKKGKLVKTRKGIAKFWIDIISTLVLQIYIMSSTPELIYLKIVFYIKAYSLLKIDASLIHFLELHKISFALYRIIRIVLFIWFITTWVGCIFFAMDFYFYNQKGTYYEEDELWLINSQAIGNLDIINDFSWDVWYQYSLYWALQTSSTIGYGDITPKNPPEVLYCCFVILFTTVLFAFFINTVWQIMGEMYLSSIEHSDNWQNLKLYLGSLKVPGETKQKMSNYLYQVWQDDDNEQLEQIIDEKLSKELRQEFYVESRQKFFDSFAIFFNFTEFGEPKSRILSELAHLINEIGIGQGQIIYKEGTFDDSAYYIKKGKVKLTIEGVSYQQKLDTNQSFGSVEYFLQTQRIQTASTAVFSKLWILKYQHMVECIKKYLFIYEKFCELTQRMIINRDLKLLQVECWKCKSESHCFLQCPSITKWRRYLRGKHEIQKASNDRRGYLRAIVKSKKFLYPQESSDRYQPLQIDKITHTVRYAPFYNLK